jgi:hypothetical protein
MSAEIVCQGSGRRTIPELDTAVPYVPAIAEDHLYPHDESSHTWKLSAVLKLEKAVTIGQQESCPN